MNGRLACVKLHGEGHLDLWVAYVPTGAPKRDGVERPTPSPEEVSLRLLRDEVRSCLASNIRSHRKVLSFNPGRL